MMATDKSENVPPTATTKNQFSTFGGVFTPCVLTILGVIMFMRADFVVGQAGIMASVAILCLATLITLLTAISSSAIATNMKMSGGGAYYLISRVLGPEFGGAIGVGLFLAQAVSVPFYILGFTEAFVNTFVTFKPHFSNIAIIAAIILFVITYIGATWAIKIQYIVMAVLALSITVFLGGAILNFSPQTAMENWSSAYTQNESGSHYSFWILFAIYFPAVTGITAGINMSGDLKNPMQSIPAGTLGAIGVGFTVYLIQIILCGGAYSRELLIERPYLVLVENALFGAGFLVAAGMFAATLSSALGSYMGAPRVLQALARDRILTFLSFFSKGSVKGDEPRRALVLTAGLTLLVLFWAGNSPGGAALNVVAGIVSMLFLYTYGMINVAAFIEAAGGNPSFRPTFKYFHWSTALAGAIGCIAVTFIISPLYALISVTFLVALVLHITSRELRVTFGDARRGFIYKIIRNALLQLAHMEETTKNWRPTSIVFSGNPTLREGLLRYAAWFEADRGIVFLVNVLVGKFDDYGPYRQTAMQELKKFCLEKDMNAFPVVLIDEDLEKGMLSALQTVSVGPIRPNMAVFGWPLEEERIKSLNMRFQVASSSEMSLVVVHQGDKIERYRRKRIDVWWRGMKNGSLMILLSHLLHHNSEWEQAEIRLLRKIDNEEGCEPTVEALQELTDDARVNATPEAIADTRPFTEILHEESGDADCIFLGFEISEPEAAEKWYEYYQDMLKDMPTTILVCSAGDEDVMV